MGLVRGEAHLAHQIVCRHNQADKIESDSIVVVVDSLLSKLLFTKVALPTACGDLTLCLDCARTMAQSSQRCPFCDVPVTRLRQETTIRMPTEEEMERLITPCSFPQKDAGDLATAKDRRAGYEEDGQNYYLLVPIRGEFVAFRADDWFQMKKTPLVAQRNLEEAEALIEKRDKSVDKTANRFLKSNPTKPGSDEKDSGNLKGDDQDDDLQWGDIVYKDDSTSSKSASGSHKSDNQSTDDEEDRLLLG
ncbi:unnamed protein product [Microthlaspi erraticum]|uniref:Transcription initiation factor IIF subunit alpha n=1 Tax=Microthlaspi erraticum TaxID=1685480 RepID=A0A6D2JVC3_9BRAS|nr:unnamed protein product [Microthlaspi erraticum]